MIPMKRILILVAAISSSLVGCSGTPDPWGEASSQPRVLASFPPIASWSKTLLGDRGTVRSLCTTTGPHHYEFQVKDGQLLRRADLFVLNGLSLDDHFTQKLIKGHAHKGMGILNLGNGLPEDLILELPHDHDHDHGAEGDHHHHGDKDPHFWLGVPQASFAIKKLAVELGRIDPDHSAAFQTRAEKLVEQLEALKAQAVAGLKNKTDRKVITMHESMGYFAKSFGIKVVDVIQANPGDEPSSPRLVKLVERCKKVGIRTIIVEPQYPKTSAAAWLSAELKKAGLEPRLIEIDPMETCDQPDGPDAEWFIKTMTGNIQRLIEGLP